MYGYVYLTVDVLKNYVYVGQHKSPTYDPCYLGSGKILKRIMKKHKDSLKNYVLEWCETKEELNDAEVAWIKNFREECGKRCLNIANGGDGGVTYVCKFRSEETRKKISEVKKGCISPMKGKHHTDETKKKISETLKNKVQKKLSGSME